MWGEFEGVDMKLVLTSYPLNLADKIVRAIGVKPKDCNVVCIPTAAMVEDNYETWLNPELNAFRAIGFTLNMLDLNGASSQECADILNKADIVYVTGGNTYYLLEKMRACHFETHIRAAMARGAIYIGSSAGSIVCTPDIDYVRSIDHPEKANLTSFTGLGLVDFYIMVHMNQSKFSTPMHDNIQKLKRDSKHVICIEDSQAVYVDGDVISIISE
jgi:dipeptidase E